MAAFTPAERTPATVITGQRGPENLNSVRVKPDVANTILFYVPEVTPLLSLSGLFRDKRAATQRQFQWLERDEYPRVTTSSTAYDDDDTSVVVATGTGSRFAAPYLIQNLRTDEIMRVTTVSTDTLTVTRGIGGTAAPIETGDKLLFLAPAYEDGADLGTLKTVQDFNLYNYTQIFRHPFGFTGRDLETDLFGGRDEKTETKAATIEHKKSIEQAFYFGKRSLATSTHEITTTGGLKYFISTNAWNVQGTPLTKRSFDEFLEEGLKWGLGGNQGRGSALKYLLMSSRWATEINSFVNNGLRYEPMDEGVIGFKAASYLSPHGEVKLVPSPLLDRNHKDHAFLIDPNHIRYVYHQGRDTSLLRNRQGNGIDGESHEYLTDAGLEVQFEQAHAILTGISV